MKIKFPLQSNLVLHFETLRRYDNYFTRKIVPTVCWDYLSEVSSKSKSGLHHIIVT